MTTFTRLELELTLTVASPFLFRGLPGKLFGLDASALRDEEGRPIVPADQVRGCLRDAFEDLAAAGAKLAAGEILELFGNQSPGEGAAATANEPVRSRLIVSDLTAKKTAGGKSLETTRINVDAETGSVREGMLQVLELVAPFGAEVEFAGHATVFVPSGDEGRWEKLFAQAMELVTAIGAVKSAGYGEVVGRSAKRVTATPMAVPKAAAGGAPRRRYRVTFDRPVLVDADWIAGNAMEGTAVIPGAVFKGALAQALIYAGEDPANGQYGRALSDLAFSHAFPEVGDSGVPGSMPLPLSLVSADGEKFGDALQVLDGKGALIGDGAGREPAKFRGDWKEPWLGAAKEWLGYPKWDEPPLLARTHTAIGHEGIAQDEALYTTLARSVRRQVSDNGNPARWIDRTWILDVAGSGADAAKLLALFETGLDGIGKTGARAKFKPIGPTPDTIPKPIHGRPGEYAVMLVTAAHMLDARTLVHDPEGVAHWRCEPRDAYAAYWTKELPGAKLEGFFASQRYTGGYLARRRRAFGNEHYHPFLITEPGSVFRLSNVNGAALDGLKELCRTGLPPATVNGQPANWRNCPYVAENGYGRIAADHLSDEKLCRRLQQVTYE